MICPPATLDRVSFSPFHIFPTCTSCLLEGEGDRFVDVDLSSFFSSFFLLLFFLRLPLPLSLRRSGGVQAVGQTIRMLSQREGGRGRAAALRYLPAPSAL